MRAKDLMRAKAKRYFTSLSILAALSRIAASENNMLKETTVRSRG